MQTHVVIIGAGPAGLTAAYLLAKENIKVNCVAPGFVKTEMLSALSFLIGEESIKGIEKQHPLGFGEPEDVANAIVFLLSSEWITGTTLFVDGGYTAQ